MKNRYDRKITYLFCLGCIVFLSACSSMESSEAIKNTATTNTGIDCFESTTVFDDINEPYQFIDAMSKCDINTVDDDMFSKYTLTLIKVGRFDDLKIILNKKGIDMDSYLYNQIDE